MSAPSSFRKALIGVGVDLVEIERAGRLVKNHPDGIRRFLNPSEARLLAAARNKPLAFALIFAAKEAASKAAGQPLNSPGMFRPFRVSIQSRRLSVRWSAPKGARTRFSLVPFTWKNLIGMVAFCYST